MKSLIIMAALANVCGHVERSNVCDVDFCRVAFVTNQYRAGEQSELPMSIDGELIGHDYQINIREIDALKGKTMCVDKAKIGIDYPVVELSDLAEAK